MENDDDVTLIFDMDEALDLLVATDLESLRVLCQRVIVLALQAPYWIIILYLKLNLRWISIKMV